MDDEMFDSKNCLFVKIDPAMSAEDAEDEDFNRLEVYMENLTKNDSKFLRFNGTRSYAIIKFEKPITDVNELQKKSDEKPLEGYKITLETIPLVDKVLVTDLPPEKVEDSDNLADSELVLYFENSKFCPDGGDVKDLKIWPCRHAVVVQFADHAVVQKLKADHKLGESHFTVRPLNIFEFVEGPCCSECKCNEDKGADDTAEDTEQASWHSANEDIGSWKNETQSGSHSNSDTDEDIDKLKNWYKGSDTDQDMDESKNWSKANEDTSSQSQNEHSSFRGGKSSSRKKFTESDDSETTQLLLKTIRYRRIPGLKPEEYDMIKLHNSAFKIMEHNKTDHTRKMIEDVKQGYGEVDLAGYTKVADKLNSYVGRKWIKELLDDLKIPADLKHDKSTLSLRAINVELAEEAAKAVAISLLPAKIKCDQNQFSKCSKLLKDKDRILVSAVCKSGFLELLGIPMDVLKAVGEIEQKLHGSRW